MNIELKIKYFCDDMPRLKMIEKGDWIDLYTAEDEELKKDEYKLIRLGVAMEIPKGYEIHIVPRSSTFKNYGILQTNGCGIVDNSYSGDNDEFAMPVFATRDIKIPKHSRICQFRLVENQPKIEFKEVAHLLGTNRGGFGTTGK